MLLDRPAKSVSKLVDIDNDNSSEGSLQNSSRMKGSFVHSRNHFGGVLGRVES